MLYEAIYTPPGEPRPDRSVLAFPGIARYAEGWGRPGDRGFLAEADGAPAGAAWYRLMHGYGWVADDIPELSIAVAPACRGRGLGTALLEALVAQTRQDGYRGLSLSVDPANPAVRLYQRLGFAQVGVDGTSVIMLKEL